MKPSNAVTRSQRNRSCRCGNFAALDVAKLVVQQRIFGGLWVFIYERDKPAG